MIQALLDYQKADARLKEIEKALSESGERKKALTAKKYLEGVEENVAKLDGRAEELGVAFAKAQQDGEKLKEQEAELMNALSEAEDENAANYLLKKAEELIAKIKAMTSAANKISEEIQVVMKEYANIKNTTKAAQVQYSENAAKYNQLKESFKEEKTAVEKELEGLKSNVSPELMERYLKKRADKIYPVLYEVKGNVCGACRMELPGAELNRLKKGEVIDCGQCGRMLYQSKQ